MEALILVAENGDPTMLARIGVMRASNRHATPLEEGGSATGVLITDNSEIQQKGHDRMTTRTRSSWHSVAPSATLLTKQGDIETILKRRKKI